MRLCHTLTHAPEVLSSRGIYNVVLSPLVITATVGTLSLAYLRVYKAHRTLPHWVHSFVSSPTMSSDNFLMAQGDLHMLTLAKRFVRFASLLVFEATTSTLAFGVCFLRHSRMFSMLLLSCYLSKSIVFKYVLSLATNMIIISGFSLCDLARLRQYYYSLRCYL